MRGDGGVAGEGRVVGALKCHSWGKCTMPLTNINSDWMSKASSGLCIILCHLFYRGPLSCILGCNEQSNHTPRCSRKFGAAGLPWLEHFRVLVSRSQTLARRESLVNCMPI